MTTKGRIIREGMGGFLNPPTHPEHEWSVKIINDGHMSLSSAVACEWLDSDTRALANALLDAWKRPPIDMVYEWIWSVLGYFRNCYCCNDGSPPEDWAAGNLIINSHISPLRHIKKHAGVHWIRSFYPLYRPTSFDFERACWGNEKLGTD